MCSSPMAQLMEMTGFQLVNIIFLSICFELIVIDGFQFIGKIGFQLISLIGFQQKWIKGFQLQEVKFSASKERNKLLFIKNESFT